MPTHEQTRDFVRRFAECEHEVYRYILTLLPDSAQAQDVFQDTAVALWEKLEAYDPSRSFVAWACGIAHNKVLMHRRRFARQPHTLSDHTLELIAGQYTTERDLIEQQVQALAECLAKLAAPQRELIEARYSTKMTIHEYARRTGRVVNTLYKSLDRIRRRLLDCVSAAMSAEGPR